MTLRVIFLGTPDFAAPSLRALIEAGHDLVAVYTQPPRPAGRGHNEKKSSVHKLADSLDLSVRTPSDLKTREEMNFFANLKADVGVVVAYGLMLPLEFINSPTFGCINLHASLLPRWRGASPIQHAILANDKSYGFTLMQIEEGLDSGPIMMKKELKVEPRPNAGILHDHISKEGAKALVSTLDKIEHSDYALYPQEQDSVTIAPKLSTKDARLDWNLSATELDCRVRAFHPDPGAWFIVNDQRIKVIEAEAVEVDGEPGTLLPDFTIACAEGGLKIQRVQRQGKKSMAAREFLRGFDFPIGTVLNRKIGGSE